MDNAEVYALLLEQKKIQEELLNLSYEKRQVIVNNNTERLNEIVQEEMKRLSEIKALEKKRETLIASLPGFQGRDDLTLSELIKSCSGDMREKLSLIQREFNALLGTLREVNALNRELIETHLEYTESMLNLAAGDADPLNNFYGGDGRTADKDLKSSGIFGDIIV